MTSLSLMVGAACLQVQSVFQALVSWRLAFPTPLLCTFASRLATPEALASASLPTLASTLDTLSRLATHQQLGAEHTPSTGIAVTAASPSGLDASFYAAVDGMCDALMEKGLGQAAAAAAAAAVTAAKVNPQAAAAAARGDGDAAAAAPSAASRQLPPTALVAVLAALQRLGSTVRPPLAAAVMRDLRAALPTLTPELLRELALVASAGGAQVRGWAQQVMGGAQAYSSVVC